MRAITSIAFCAVLVCGMGGSSHAGAGGPASTLRAVVAPMGLNDVDSLDLTPAALPAGSFVNPESVEVLPGEQGETVTFRKRYINLPTNIHGTLYIEIESSPAPIANPANEAVQMILLGKGQAVHVVGGATNEYRWRIAKNRTVTVGSVGAVSNSIVESAALSMQGTLSPDFGMLAGADLPNAESQRRTLDNLLPAGDLTR